MRSHLRRIRDGLLDAPDTVCLERARLVTEACRRFDAEPPVLKRARAFAHVLANMTLDVDSNPFFAGNTSSRPHAWMLIPEHGMTADPQVLIENDGLDDILEGRIPEDIRRYWADRAVGGSSGIGHLAVDMGRAVHEGLESVIAEAESRPDEPDPAKRDVRAAMALACRAVIAWAQRYADAAAAAAERAADPVIRAAHRRVAAACRHVPARPARDLFEALQTMALVHLAVAIEGHGMSISIGLPDRVLAPFAGEAGEASGATELLAAFLLKIAANSFQGRGSKTQAVTIGGADHRGADRSNDLTLRLLEAWDLVRVADPHVFVRWHARLDARVKARAVDMLGRGLSLPLLVHDEPTARGLIGAGVAPEDAWEYCVIGCNELGIPGRMAKAALGGCLVNYLEQVNRALLEEGAAEAIAGMDALAARLERRMREHLLAACPGGPRRNAALAARAPTPFTSALMRGCAARGVDMHAWECYNLLGLYERGLTSGANALAAIERVVFEDRAVTLPGLVEALRGDFRGAGGLREKLRAAPKWGNDDDRADRWALALLGMRERALAEAEARLGLPRHLPCHVVRSLHRVDGRRIGATPDGRRAAAPVADSIGAETGTAHEGPTAILNSVLKIDAPRFYPGGYNLNLTLSRDHASPEILAALIEAFFADGGQELQIGCLDADRLRAAQQDPEKHRDLIVRIAGFNALFVKLSRQEQDELIERAESVRSRPA